MKVNLRKPISYSYSWIGKKITKAKQTFKPKDTVKIDYWDLWSLDISLAQVIRPALVAFSKVNYSYGTVDVEDLPEHTALFTDLEKWQWIVSEMIWAFEKIADPHYDNEFFVKSEFAEFGLEYNSQAAKVVEDRINNGLRLFGKYYRALWT